MHDAVTIVLSIGGGLNLPWGVESAENSLCVCAHARACARVCARACACAHVCVRAFVCACVRVRAHVRVCLCA